MILVTGSTGKVGQQLVSTLKQAGVKFQALARSDASAKELAAQGVATVRGDLGDPTSFRAALRGVERLFLLSSGADPHAAETGPIATAKAAGVRHLVKLSAMNAHADAANSFLRGHARIERAIEASGMAWTFVRPTFFMQNWVLFNAPGIRAGQPIYTNTGDARVAWVDTRDIAAVAAAALTGDGHVGRVYELTGPQAFSYAEVGNKLGALLGRKVEHVAVSDRAAYEAMCATGMPADYAFALTTLNQAARGGLGAATTGTVELVTGRPSRDLDAFLREHVAEFRA